MSLARLQQVVVEALAADDPKATLALARARPDQALTAAERALLAGVDDDGLRLTALLVKKLRFEAILRGDPETRRRFERDPAGVARTFERYLRAEPRRALFPAEEAERFRAFAAR